MIWRTDKDKTEQGKACGADSPAPANATDAAKPLSLLAQKLGALEQSLTVVASEIGVSGMPQFKHLDADKVYAEAVRVARQAATEERRDLDARVRETAAAVAAIGVRLDSELHGTQEKLGDLTTRLDAMTALSEDMRHRLDQQRSAAQALTSLQERLEALEQRSAAAMAMPPAAPDGALLDGLMRRLDALEQRVQSQPAPARDEPEWPFADDTPPAEAKPVAPAPDLLARQREIIANAQRDIVAAVQRDVNTALQQRLGQALAQLEAQLVARIERHLEQIKVAEPQSDNVFSDPPPTVPAANIEGLHAAIASELAVLLARKTERNEPTPLLAERSGDINPLVMTAAERAIVRLTHRIEKLEKQLDGGSESRRTSGLRPGSRSSRTIVGRLFES